MGYYTQYTLKVEGDNPTLEEVADVLVEISDYGVRTIWWVENLKGEDVAKWYDYQKNMKQLSARYPNVLFTLHGLGEEAGDEWVEYYKNGKYQREVREEWSPPAFNPKALK